MKFENNCVFYKIFCYLWYISSTKSTKATHPYEHKNDDILHTTMQFGNSKGLNSSLINGLEKPSDLAFTRLQEKVTHINATDILKILSLMDTLKELDNVNENKSRDTEGQKINNVTDLKVPLLINPKTISNVENEIPINYINNKLVILRKTFLNELKRRKFHLPDSTLPSNNSTENLKKISNDRGNVVGVSNNYDTTPVEEIPISYSQIPNEVSIIIRKNLETQFHR